MWKIIIIFVAYLTNSTNIMEKIYQFYVLSSSNEPNNIRYVGVTTVSLQRRLIQHRNKAKSAKYRMLPVHKWMYSVYKKGFDVLINKIDECDESKWEEKEQYLIKKYKDQGYKLMNLDKGGKGVITSEMRSKSSIERCAEKHRKPIIALTLDGKFFKEFPSLTSAVKYFHGNNITNIGNVLRHATKSAYNHLWVYKKDYYKQKKYLYSKDRHGKKIYQFNLEGKLINIYDAIIDIKNKIGISYNGLNSAIINKKEYYNSYWSYNRNINVDKYKSPYNYEVINMDDDSVHYFRYQKEVAVFINFSKTNVQKYMSKEKIHIWNNYKVIRIN